MTKQNLKQPKLTGGMSVHRNNLVMSFLRTILFLAVMVIGTGSSWAGYTIGSINNGVDGTNGSNATWTQETKTYVWSSSTGNGFTVNGLTDLSQGSHLILETDELTGEYRVYITVGGTTYHRVLSGTGQIVIDLKDNNWRTDVWKPNTATKLPDDLSNVSVYFAGFSSSGSVKVNSIKLASLDSFEITTAPGSSPAWLRYEGPMRVAVIGFESNLSTTNEKKFLKLDNQETSHIKLIFPKGMVKAGDILTIRMANYYNSAGNVGFSVDGGGNANADNAANESVLVSYKIRSTNIKSEDSNQDYIIITRKDYGCAFNSFEISSPERYLVNWDNSKVKANCDAWYTIDDDPTEYRTTTLLASSNSKVTYHMTSTGSTEFIENGWHLIKERIDKHLNDINEYKSLAYSNPMTWTVTEDVNIYPEFQNCFRVFAEAENGATATVTGGSGKKYFWQATDLTFSTTVPDGYTFDGWYNGGSKESSLNPYNKGTYQPGDGVTDLTLTARFRKNVNTIGKPYCNHAPGKENGDNYFNIGNLNAGPNVTIADASPNGKTVTVSGSQNGYVSFNFSEAYNLSDLARWTISDVTETRNGVVAVEFLKDGTSMITFNNNAGNRESIDASLKTKLESVDEIRIHFKPGSYTFPWIRFTFEHADRVKPVLSEGTSTDMRVFTGDNLILANGSGFWRQYTDNTYNTIKSDGFIPTNEWEKRYVITADRLTKDEDYYFRVVDSSPCALGYQHSSEAVDVHVKVTDPINKVEVSGTTRQYDVYAPEGITSSESSKVGVVISLHGASNDYWNGRVDFNAIADAKKDMEGKKFVVVYPRGLMRQLRGQERGWESYTESNTEDVEFFKAIVTELKKTYSVDMSRIYLAGFSNGGMMAYKAAHQAGDFFAAFASVGGYPVNESHLFHAGAKPTPFIHIQGKADTVFPSTTYDLSTIAHNMTYRNGAKFNPYDNKGQNLSDGGVIADNTNVTREIHPAENGGAPYYLYTITDMTHVPAYSWDGVDGDDVAPAIWNFFDKMTEYYAVEANKIDKTLKFRMDDPDELWTIAKTGKSSKNVEVGYIGFDNVDNETSVLSYGGRTKTDNSTAQFDKDSNNRNLWHSLQFNGGINGAAHFLKLNVYTEKVTTENPNEFFLVKLTKTGDTTPVFAKRYQAGRGQKDLYINFVALPGFNEYKLEITKSSSELVVKVHGMEFYSGRCEDKGTNEHPIEENPVFFYDVEQVLTGMNPIYQPVFDKSYDGIAKEFLPIADIPVGVIPVDDPKHPSDIPTSDYRVINNDLVGDAALTSLPSTVIAEDGWTNSAGRYTATITSNTLFNIAKSGKTGEDEGIKSKNAFIFVKNGEGYTIDRVKGLCISQHGRAMMPEYLNGTRGAFPDHGVIAIKLQGTLDFYLLAQNEVTYDGTDPSSARRTLKVYYTNDQLDGELKELKEWLFFGTRSEDGYNDKNGQSLAALSAGVRLPQLGKDGTCTVFITYEGREKGAGPFTHDANDADKIWIKGFVIKRPDLKVTIGRTDSKYSGKKYNGEDNTYCTRFGENKPYIWSFENVGFNNTKNENLNDKKVNVEDGRTYVCGGTDDSMDHLLLYSDTTKIKDPVTGKLILDNKVQFDGRLAGQEHIEFLKPSVYNIPEATDNRCIFDPIQSNGLKVNVTGSGWFKIKCAAPNGKVKMKVYSSTNYGASYINLLREFEVDNNKHPESATGKEEHKWGEYTVYLKGHVNRIADKDKAADQRRAQIGFWDGDLANSYDKNAEEILRMSLFVVFERMDGVAYKEDLTGPAAEPQLNIHQLSWLNEEPADYVFQREEDPKLLTEWQEIKRNDKTILYWKACNDNDSDYPVLKENGNDTYNRLGQKVTQNLVTEGKGVQSPGGYASTSVPSDAGKYNASWDIAAPASTGSHTEAAYARGNKVIVDSSPQYVKSGANEFSIPVSGSFIRFCAMKNTYVVAHVIPGAANGDVYVLDETGAPIGFDKNTDDGKRRGYIATMLNTTDSRDEKKSGDATIRIDFCANAGKEYFICANGASISLARLEVQDWRYNPAKAAEKLAVADNAADNGSKITAAYNAGIPYMDANLRRKVTGKWISLVLPFSMNEKKFEEVFGKGAKCIHFTDVDIPGKTVKLTHHYYNMIVAGRPVFVKPGTSPNVDDSGYLKDIEDVTLQTKTVSSYRTPDKKFEFFGSYDKTTMKRNDLFMNNNNAIKFLTDETATYPGMRSFIKNYNGPDFSSIIDSSTPAQGKFVNFCDLDDDNVTDIEELITAEFGENVVVIKKSTKVYDLLGNPVADGSRIDNLPAGIYIVNGKKFVVK